MKKKNIISTIALFVCLSGFKAQSLTFSAVGQKGTYYTNWSNTDITEAIPNEFNLWVNPGGLSIHAHGKHINEVDIPTIGSSTIGAQSKNSAVASDVSGTHIINAPLTSSVNIFIHLELYKK